MVTAFAFLIVLQFAVIVSHDLIDIRGWVHGSQVQAAIGRRKVLLATLANAVFRGWPQASPSTSGIELYRVSYRLTG